LQLWRKPATKNRLSVVGVAFSLSITAVYLIIGVLARGDFDTVIMGVNVSEF